MVIEDPQTVWNYRKGKEKYNLYKFAHSIFNF